MSGPGDVALNLTKPLLLESLHSCGIRQKLHKYVCVSVSDVVKMIKKNGAGDSEGLGTGVILRGRVGKA